MSLDEAKSAVRAKYLGKLGVHAVGIRRAADAVCVYVEPGRLQDVEATRAEMERIAGGHALMVVVEEQAVRQ